MRPTVVMRGSLLELLGGVPFGARLGIRGEVAVEERIRVGHHRAQFPDAEDATVPAEALLRVERVVAVQHDQSRADQDQRQPERRACQHQRHIDGTLDESR
jgi:hypothetical protein